VFWDVTLNSKFLSDSTMFYICLIIYATYLSYFDHLSGTDVHSLNQGGHELNIYFVICEILSNFTNVTIM
jgi:hypothetical protein